MGAGQRSFLFGVGSFFAARVSYVTGLASAGPASHGAVSHAGGLKTAAVVWAVAAPVMTIAAGRKGPELRFPIAAYATVLATMYATSTQRPNAGWRSASACSIRASQASISLARKRS